MSNTVDWSKAPDKASCYADGRFWNYLQGYNEWLFFNGVRWELDCEVRSPDNFADYQPRPAPQEKPMKYEYGVEYPTNGVKPDLPDDVLVEFKDVEGRWDLGEYEVRAWAWDESSAFRIVDDRYKPAAAPVEQTNKYDRTITGKYGTGKCTIDVYRVIAAYDVTDSEVAHAVKKLLAPGQRGVKEERQDIEEAIQSLQAWIARMDDEGVK